MFYFRTRALRNTWYKDTGKKYELTDMGADAPAGRRWAVKVL